MYTLFIADDNPIERAYLHSFISNHFSNDFQIVGEARDGKETLELAQSISIDVFLLDIQMPKLDGLETAEQLRTFNHEATIVFITSYADFAYAQKAVRLGVSDYLLKPFIDEDLMEMLEQILIKLDKGRRNKIITKEIKHPELDHLAAQFLFNKIIEENEPWHSTKTLLNKQPTHRDAFKVIVLFPCAKNSVDAQFISILKGIFNKKKLHCLIWTRQAEIVVFLFGDKARDFQELEASIQRARVFLNNEPGQNVYSGVSSFYNNLLTLREAYLEAVFYMSQFGPPSLAENFETNKKMVANLQHLKKIMISTLLSRRKTEFVSATQDYLAQSSDNQTFKYLIYLLISSVFDVLGKKETLESKIHTSFNHLDTLDSFVQKQTYLITLAEELAYDLGEGVSYHNIRLTNKTIQLIQNRYREKITLMEIAEELQISYSHLSKCFSQVTGTSFNAFLLQTRMQEVMRLMREPIDSIAALGKQVGIEDPYYFSKSFKKFTGLTPSEYLKLFSLKR